MKEQIKYRTVHREDAFTILEIDKSFYEEDALSIFYIKDCYELYRKSFYVATENNIVIGFCIGLSSKSEQQGWISALVVLKEHRKKGIGAQLTNHVLKVLKSLGCTTVSLTAEQGETNFYKKLGFEIMGEKKKDYYGEGKDRFKMKKTLK